MIEDIPIGKYKITARDAVQNRNLKVRLRNQHQTFGKLATDLFEPACQGATGNYKNTIEVA
ncbi:hypothetical protein BH24BAC1_BH24BAC1_34550 [soil metagenome]